MDSCAGDAHTPQGRLIPERCGPDYHAAMHKELAGLRRRPFLTPVWLSALGAAVTLAVIVWLVASASTTTVFVIRHAEKAAGGDPDPTLSVAGQLRAERLAQVFGAAGSHYGLQAIIVTERRRTQETARPLANALGIPVIVVPADQPAAAARRALGDYAGQRVLIIGHANTVPAIVKELTGEGVPDLAETDYATLYVASRPRFSRSSLTVLRLP